MANYFHLTTIIFLFLLMKYLIVLLAFALPFICFSQTDSAIIYKNKQGSETTKDSAFVYEVITKHDALWHAKIYYSKGNVVQSEGDYLNGSLDKPVGSFDNYLEDGSLFMHCNYTDGVITDKTYYYKNGSKKSYLAYKNNNAVEQKGWDENGKEITGYIAEREAKFKGGADAWGKYLEKNLDSKVAVNAGKPAGNYEVTAEFLITKDGTVSNVKANSGSTCKPCEAEVINILLNSPPWLPAIQNNEAVIYRQKQKITFQVTEGKKKSN